MKSNHRFVNPSAARRRRGKKAASASRYDARNQFERHMDCWTGGLIVALMLIPILWILNRALEVGGAALQMAEGAALLYGGTLLFAVVVGAIAAGANWIVNSTRHLTEDTIPFAVETHYLFPAPHDRSPTSRYRRHPPSTNT